MAEVQVIVEGRSYSGWKSVSIDRDIEQLCGRFELAVSAKAPDGTVAADLRDGQKVIVAVDNETVITGFIDGFEISHSATEHTITVIGRDAAGDLVDCSAMFKTGQWSGQGMLAIVKDLVSAYGIQVTVETSLGAPFEQWNIEPGETVFENIERMARHRGVLVMSDGLGGIVITKPGTDLVGTALVLGQNILRGRITRSCEQRYSQYHVLGTRQRDDYNEPDTTSPRGKANDGFITRHRPLVCCYEDTNASLQTLTERARWQAAVNAARSQRVVVTVQGWSHANGLWRPNRQVVVTDERLRLDRTTLLIAGVRYTRGREGTLTDLSLAPRDSFLVDKMPEEIA